MRLIELDPQFLRYATERRMGRFEENGATVERMHDAVFLPHVDRIGEAQGVEFLCPKCFKANGGRVGTHGVICWSRSRGVPEAAEPGPAAGR